MYGTRGGRCPATYTTLGHHHHHMNDPQDYCSASYALREGDIFDTNLKKVEMTEMKMCR